MAGNYYYSFHNSYGSLCLFGNPGVFRQNNLWACPLLTSQELGKLLKVRQSTLIVPPFQLKKYGQIYVNPQEIIIDLKKLMAGFYRIIVVHNFLAEDRNPNLTECLAGIFLAGHDGERSEEPENHPVECRLIETLADLNSKTGELFYPK